MDILDTLDGAKAYLKKIKRNYTFRRNRLAHERSAELQNSLGKCNGQLTLCKHEFNSIIREQSGNIKKGAELGADTIIQEQLLWDAAIGYMLVRDAIYALESINSYDSVAHAYDMLDVATKLMTGKQKSVHQFTNVVPGRERNAYGYITSSAAARKKAELLDTFFEQLKETGDIEKCLQQAMNPSDAGDKSDSITSNGDAAAAIKRLDDLESKADAAEDYTDVLSDAAYSYNPKITD